MTDCSHFYVEIKRFGKGYVVVQLQTLGDVVIYLRMAHKLVNEMIIDTQLMYALAKVHKMAEREELDPVLNVAKIDQIRKHSNCPPRFIRHSFELGVLCCKFLLDTLTDHVKIFHNEKLPVPTRKLLC